MVTGSGVANPRAPGSTAAGSGLPIRPDLESPLTVDPSGRSCVDCGLATGNFCDGGMSCEFDKVATPLCTYCETLHDFCRFCRREQSCTPPLRQTHWSGQPHRLSRDYARLVPGIERARRLAWAIAEEVANPRVDNPRVGVDNDENAVDFAQRRTKCPTLFFGGGMTGDVAVSNVDENAVVPVTDWYGPHLAEEAVDFALRRTRSPTLFIGGGTTGEVAVCDKTPHRFLAQRYRDHAMSAHPNSLSLRPENVPKCSKQEVLDRGWQSLQELGYIGGRELHSFETFDEKPFRSKACGGDKVSAARGQKLVKCKELKEQREERWTAITPVEFWPTSTTSTELS